MNLLFKTSSVPSGVIPNVGHSNFKQHYPAVNRQMAWDTLQPYIRQATQRHIIRWIGEPLYTDLSTKYNSGDTLTSSQSALLEQLQDAIAYYTVHDAMPSLNISVADMGIQQLSGTEGTTNPPSQWAFNNARWDALINAEKALDTALTNLELYAKSDSYYALWKDHDAYKLGNTDFFRVCQELSNYINVQGDRRAFVALIPYLKKVEKSEVMAIICKEAYAILATKLKECMYSEGFNNGFSTECFTSAQVELIVLLQRFISHKGLYDAIPHLTLSIEAEGFRLLGQSDFMNDKKPITNSFHLQAINALREQCEYTARTALADINEYLYANSASFPEWKASNCYVEETTPTNGCWSPTGAIML
jgi:hypothetical protein